MAFVALFKVVFLQPLVLCQDDALIETPMNIKRQTLFLNHYQRDLRVIFMVSLVLEVGLARRVAIHLVALYKPVDIRKLDSDSGISDRVRIGIARVFRIGEVPGNVRGSRWIDGDVRGSLPALLGFGPRDIKVLSKDERVGLPEKNSVILIKLK